MEVMDNKVTTSLASEEVREHGLTKSEFRVIWESIHLKVTDKYEVPPEIIQVNGSTIGTLGNFSASTGKAKSKKTFNVSAIVAAALSNNEVLRYTAAFPENKRKVLYIDTEQSKYHCHKVQNRILQLAGQPIDQECPNLLFVTLREMTPEYRRTVIDYMLYQIKGIGLVVIDGIRDLMYDINNPSESTEVINMLMQWSSCYNLHIHTVLHLNKGDDNTRGHIGTELNNKAETVLQITKSQTDANISEVRAMHMRDKEFEPFAFCINTDSLPELVDNYKFDKKQEHVTLTELSDESHREALGKAFEDSDQLGYNDLIDALGKGYAYIGYERGRNALIAFNKWLMKNGYIIKKDKKYSLVRGIYNENQNKPNPQNLFDDEH